MRLGNDFGHFRMSEFYKGIVSGFARLFVAREPQAKDLAELGEIGPHLAFEKTVRNASKVYDRTLSLDEGIVPRHCVKHSQTVATIQKNISHRSLRVLTRLLSPWISA